MHSTRNGRSAHLSWCGDLKDGKDLHRTPRLVQGQENCTLIESMCQVHIYMLRSVTRQRIYYWSVESHRTWSYRRLWGIRHGHQEATCKPGSSWRAVYLFFLLTKFHCVAPKCPGTSHIDYAGFRLIEICLPLPECWDLKHAPLYMATESSLNRLSHVSRQGCSLVDVMT